MTRRWSLRSWQLKPTKNRSGPLCCKTARFREAVDSLTGLNPQNTIEDLHTKTVQSGGSFVGQIGEFLHVVAFGEKGRAELLERLNSKSGAGKF